MTDITVQNKILHVIWHTEHQAKLSRLANLDMGVLSPPPSSAPTATPSSTPSASPSSLGSYKWIKRQVTQDQTYSMQT